MHLSSSAAPPSETLLAGRYLLGEEIGSGGMGRVYRATDLRTGGPVAVKLLHPSRARDAAYRERLRREAQIAAQLTSPRVVRVVDLDEHEGAPFLVLEYVAGESLARRLEREGALPLAEGLAITREVAHALEAAYAAGIVHRDLKPENVTLVDGQVKVLDFGIARAEGIPGLTLTDSWVGTAQYAAPERVRGEGDIRSDVYSLGVMLFRLVTGRLPFEGESPLAILRQHEEAPPPIPAGLPPLVQGILARCLAKDPEARYRTPAELVADLDEALAAPATSMESAGTDATALLPVVAGARAEAAGGARAVAAAPRSNLPPEVTSFVGREEECASLRGLLADARVLTLLGPGGIGKTRLAVRVASAVAVGPESVSLCPDGVWLVSLVGLPDAEQLTEAVAGVLGVREVRGRALDATLVEALRPRRLVLVLDNCEHLLAACAALVELLVRGCPHVRVLATSREALGVPAEVVWRVPPLDPDSEGVRLFAERAAVARPGYVVGPETEGLVAEIGRRLDGLPLAIELAAARVKVLSVAEIAARLKDRFRLLTAGSRNAPPHHQTLRTAIGWSYELLTQREQAIFRRLGVFARGCTLEAAEAVVPEGHGEDVLDVLDVLAALVDKSLLAHETGADGSRYAMLQTIREYALERLRAEGEEEAVAMRHLAYCVRLAEEADRGLRGRDQLTWLARLDEEQANLRAVLDWCADGGVSPPAAAGLGLRMATALGWYWYLRGQHSEGSARFRHLLQRAIAADPGGTEGHAARAVARAVAAHLAFWGPDPSRSVELAEQACRLARRGGDALVLAWCLLYRGMVEPRGAEGTEAPARWAESLALFRAAGENWGVALSLAWLGRYAQRAGEAALAVQHLEESLSLFRLLGDRWGTQLALARLAGIAEETGDYARAEEYLTEQQALACELGHQAVLAVGLERLGRLSVRRGEVALARERYERSVSLFREIGEQRSTAAPLRELALLAARHEGNHERAEALLRESLRVWQGQDGVIGPIRSLLGCGEVALLRGDGERAVRFLAAAEAEIARSRADLDGVALAELEKEAEGLRRMADRVVRAGAWNAAGGEPVWSLAEAIAQALR